MPLELKSATRLDCGDLRLTYRAWHSTPGAEGTVVDQIVDMDVRPGKTTVAIAIDECEAPTPDEALQRLSRWLRRLADGIDQRGESIKLPLS